MKLPAVFIHNVKLAFGLAGEQFLVYLPSLIKEASSRWQLTIGEPFELSFNYVVPAIRADGTPAVLKIGVPNRELTSEIEALRLYNGRGIARLLEADAEKGFLLQERLLPGTMLSEMQDDDRATEIAAQIIQTLWQTAPENDNLIRLEDWFKGLDRYRQKYPGSEGPLPKTLVDKARNHVRGLFAENEPDVVLHGDCHHYNILQSGHDWKAIDPKGVIGPRGYDVGPLLANPYPSFLEHPEPGKRIRRRIAILSEYLQMETDYIRRWALAQFVLSASWDLDENGQGGEYAIRCAQLITNP